MPGRAIFLGEKGKYVNIYVNISSPYFNLFIHVSIVYIWNGMLKNCHHFNPFDWDLFYIYGGNFTVVFFPTCL